MVKVLGIIVLCLLAVYAFVSLIGFISKIVMTRKLRKKNVIDKGLDGETDVVQPDVESVDNDKE